MIGVRNIQRAFESGGSWRIGSTYILPITIEIMYIPITSPLQSQIIDILETGLLIVYRFVRRGKGDHRGYIKTIYCLHNGIIFEPTFGVCCHSNSLSSTAMAEQGGFCEIYFLIKRIVWFIRESC
ncbi:hypothetical protein D3C71_1427330 [compost metagenome]